jgi:protoheme IX farnesyltransferase
MTIGPFRFPAEDAHSLGVSTALAYLELTKPRVNLLVALTAAAGFYMGARGAVNLLALVNTVVGTGLVAGGSSALNQLMEQDLDARMARTAGRPLPSGRIAPNAALVFGLALIALGAVQLATLVNPFTSLLGLVTSILYLLIYTPLKTRTPLCTTVGALPGAIPPLMGWAGATDTLNLGAVGLFLILLLWQFPHFLAISWAYRSDYEQGGFSMLPTVDPQGGRTARRIIVYSLFLVLCSFAPTAIGTTGVVYAAGAALMGLALLGFGVRAARLRSRTSARALSLATVIYLPMLMALMIVDKV